MNEPQIPPNSQETTAPLVPLIAFALVSVIIIIIVVVMIVMYEQRHRAEQQTISVVTPQPISNSSPVPSPTPLLVYQPILVDINKQQATGIFLDVTGLNNPASDPIAEQPQLARWQRAKIPVRLRGQSDPADEQCLQDIKSQLNLAMETSLLEDGDTNRSPFEIYVLPPDQYATVHIDYPRDRESFIIYYQDHNAAITDVDMVIPADKVPAERCWHMRSHTLKALGLLDYTAEPLPDSFISESAPPISATYSKYDLEMIRILYSDLMTAELTKNEVERRLQ